MTGRILLILCFALTALAAGGPAAKAATDVGTAQRVVNQVSTKTFGQQVQRGDGLAENETVITQRRSAIDILMSDRSTLLVGENSEMVLDSLTYDTDKNLVTGSMRMVSGVMRMATSGTKMDFGITTPHATIGIRGTKFDVLSSKNGTEVAVIEGVVVITSAAGTVVVSDGQVYRVSATGGAQYLQGRSAQMDQAIRRMLSLVATAPSGGGGSTAAVPASEQTAISLGASPTASGAGRRTSRNDNLLYMDLEGGRVVIEMLPDQAPQHVARIKQLVRQGFYDGLGFHFVEPGYVAETGDPTGTGKGGSGQHLRAELSNTVFDAGTVGMSRSRNDINSGDSQFFIVLGRAPVFDGKYTAWGRVISGLDVVGRLKKARLPADPERIIRMRVAADVQQTRK